MIYHYTSIANLALILSSQNFRFSRLDQVDDIQEIDGLKEGFGKITFISCWTEDEEENIALWKMYTENMSGVRIGCPIMPFRMIKTPPGKYGTWELASELIAPFPPDELTTDTYNILPYFQDNHEKPTFFKKVMYVRDQKASYEQVVFDNREKKNVITYRDFQDIGRFKSDKWVFQNESRFTLFCVPVLPIDHPLINGDRLKGIDIFSETIYGSHEALRNHLPYQQYVDLPLDHTVLNSLEITLGPRCSLSEQLIVQALLEKYTSNATIKKSSLDNTIRFK